MKVNRKIKRKGSKIRDANRVKHKSIAERVDSILFGGTWDVGTCIQEISSSESESEDVNRYKRRVAKLEAELADIQADCDDEIDSIKRDRDESVWQVEDKLVAVVQEKEQVQQQVERLAILEAIVEEKKYAVLDLTKATTNLQDLLEDTENNLVAERALHNSKKEELEKTQASNQTMRLELEKQRTELLECRTAKEEADELGAQVVGLEEQLALSLEDLSRLTQQTTSDQEALVKERDEHTREVSRLRDLLLTAEEGIKCSGEKIKAKAKEVEEIETTVVFLRSEIENGQQALVHAGERYDEFKIDLEKERKKVEEAERSKDILSQKVLELEAQVTTEKGVREEAIQTADSKTMELQQALKSIETSQTEVIGLTHRLSCVEEDLEGASKLTQDQEEKLKAVELVNESLSQNVGELQRQLEETTEKKQSEIDSTVEKILAKEAEIMEVATTNEGLRQQVATLEENFTSLQSRFDTNCAKLAESQKAYDSLQHEISEMETAMDQQVKTSSSDLEQAIAFRQAKENELVGIEKVNITLRESVDLLTEKLAKMEEELESSTNLCQEYKSNLDMSLDEKTTLQEIANSLRVKLGEEVNVAEVNLMQVQSELEQVQTSKDKELEKSRSINEQLGKEVEGLQSQIGIMQSEIGKSFDISLTASRDLESASAREEVLRSLVSDLKNQLQGAHDKAQKDLFVMSNDKANALEEAVSTISELRAEVSDLKKQLALKQEALNNTSNMAISTQTVKEATAAELQDAQSELDTLREKVASLEGDLQAAYALCDEHRAQLNLRKEEDPHQVTILETQLEESKRHLSVLTADLMTLQLEKENYDETKQSLAKKQAEIEELNEQVTSLEGDLNEAKSLCDEHRAQFTLQSEEDPYQVAMLETQLEESKRHTSVLTADLMALQLEKENFDETKQSLAKKQAEIDELNDHVTSLEGELNEAKSLCDERQAQLDLRSEDDSYQVAMLEKQLEASKRQMSVLTADLMTLQLEKEDFDDAKLSLAQKQAEVDELNEKLVAAEARLELQNVQHKERGLVMDSSELNEANVIIASMTTKLTDTQAELEQVKAACDEKQKLLEEADEASEPLHQQVQDLLTQINSQNVALEIARTKLSESSEISSDSADLIELQTKIYSLETGLVETIKTRDALVEDNENLKRQLNEEVVSATNVQAMQMDKETHYRKRNEELTAEIAKVKCQLEITAGPIVAENMRLLCTIEQQQKQLESINPDLEKEHNLQKAKLQAYEQSNATLTKDITELRSKHDVLERQRDELSTTVSELESQISELTGVTREVEVKSLALADQEANLEKSQNMLAISEQRLSELNEAIIIKGRTIETQSASIQHLKVQLKTTEQEGLALRKRIEQIDVSKLNVKEVEDAKQVLVGQMEAMKVELSRYKNRNTTLCQEIGTLRSNLGSTAEVKMQQEGDLKDIKYKFDRLERETKTWREKMGVISKELLESQDKNTQLDKESKEYSKRNSALTAELETVRRRLTGAITEHGKTKEALKGLETQFKTVAGEKEQSQSLVSILKKSVSDRDVKSAQLDRSEKEKAGLVKRLADMHVQRCEWERDASAYKETRSQLEKIESEKKSLESHVTKLQVSNKAAAQYIKKLQEARQAKETAASRALSTKLSLVSNASESRNTRSTSPVKEIRIVTTTENRDLTSPRSTRDALPTYSSPTHPERRDAVDSESSSSVEEDGSQSSHGSGDAVKKFHPPVNNDDDAGLPAAENMKRLYMKQHAALQAKKSHDGLDLDEAAMQVVTAIPNAFSSIFGGGYKSFEA